MKKLGLTKSIWAVFVFVALFSGGFIGIPAQVFTDFEGGSLEGWRAVGDGTFYLEQGTGNPGNCLRVDDDATGSMLYALAPVQFLGDWSAATGSDSLKVDIYLHLINGTPLVPERVFTLSGPGGRAFALSGNQYSPANDTWTHMAVNLDSSNWTISEGNWNDLLATGQHAGNTNRIRKR